MIVAVGCYVLTSDVARLSRLLDTLFGGQLPKLPHRIGRTEHLATGLGSAVWCFNADGHARFLGPVRAPGRLGKPQSNGGQQRRDCQGQMFCFHSNLLFDSSFTFTFAAALCADFRELAFDLERRRGILVQSASEQE